MKTVTMAELWEMLRVFLQNLIFTGLRTTTSKDREGSCLRDVIRVTILQLHNTTDIDIIFQRYRSCSGRDQRR